ncbi:helix-turn-helix transcriptional regulator [bacterium]|nr:helix-turn-helix transcriptional regulator [bacterium]
MNWVYIDSEKLQEAIKKRGLTPREVSVEIGMGAGYISKACTKGKLPKTSMIALEQLFNIKEDEIKFIEEIQPPVITEIMKAEAPIVNQFDKEELFDIIYHATYKAMKEALEN